MGQFIVVLCVVLLTLGVSPAIAQTGSLPVAPEGSPVGSSELDAPLFTTGAVSQVHVGSLEARVVGRNLIEGSFSVYNTEDASVVDLQYELLLLDALPTLQPDVLYYDNAPAYDRLIVDVPFSLSPKEIKRVPISYQAPLVPEGKYRLRVQLRTSNDRELGWADIEVQLGGSQSFVIVEPESVSVRATDPISHESRDDWLPLEGPNVDPNQSFVIGATLVHRGTRSVTARPVVSVERILAAKQNVVRTFGDPVTLRPGEARQFVMPVAAQETPGAYRVLLTFESNGQKVSGVGEYRYVVKGVSASIVSQEIEQFPTRAGEKAIIRFSVAGSADRQTLQQAIIEIALLDDGTVVGVEKTAIDFVNPVGLVDGVAEIVLQKDICSQPHLRITTTSQDGTTLDVYETEVNVTPACDTKPVASDRRGMIVVGGIILELFIAAVVAFLVLWKLGFFAKKKNLSSKRVASLIIVLGVGIVGLLYGSAIAQTDKKGGITYKEFGGAHLVVTQPGHGAQLSSPTFTYEAKVSWVSCANAVHGGELVLSVPEGGGCYPDIAGVSGSELSPTRRPRSRSEFLAQFGDVPGMWKPILFGAVGRIGLERVQGKVAMTASELPGNEVVVGAFERSHARVKVRSQTPYSWGVVARVTHPGVTSYPYRTSIKTDATAIDCKTGRCLDRKMMDIRCVDFVSSEALEPTPVSQPVVDEQPSPEPTAEPTLVPTPLLTTPPTITPTYTPAPTPTGGDSTGDPIYWED